MNILGVDQWGDEVLSRTALRDEESCWEWLGAKSGGYGRIGRSVGGEKVSLYTHRIVYEYLRGPIPEGLQIDHLCRNRGCQNPWHMEPVTLAENTARGEFDGSRWRELPTHCVNGHELSGENIRMEGNRRRCRPCQRDRARRYKRRKLGWLYSE